MHESWFGAALALLLTLCTTGCASEQRYEVHGRVVGFGDDGRIVIVEHQEVEGLMPAMTMPFTARDSTDVGRLSQGDAVAFTLVLDGKASWIQEIRELPPDAVPPASEPEMATASLATAPLLEEGDPLPAFTLIDQAGRPLRSADYQGRALLLTFIYTRCPMPDFCPLMSRNFQRMQPELAERYGDHVQLLSVSFDPAYDTPDVLRAYARRYARGAETWRFATGPQSAVDSLASAFGVYTRTEHGEIIHNLVTALIGPEGRVHRLWRGSDWTTDEVLAAVQELGVEVARE